MPVCLHKASGSHSGAHCFIEAIYCSIRDGKCFPSPQVWEMFYHGPLSQMFPLIGNRKPVRDCAVIPSAASPSSPKECVLPWSARCRWGCVELPRVARQEPSKGRWGRRQRACLVWLVPAAACLIASPHKHVFKGSPAAQFDQIRPVRLRFSSWTGTHRGVNRSAIGFPGHRDASSDLFPDRVSGAFFVCFLQGWTVVRSCYTYHYHWCK